MMTISDIFDALSAADRPYKRAVPIERALDILGPAVEDGELDARSVRAVRRGAHFRPLADRAAPLLTAAPIRLSGPGGRAKLSALTCEKRLPEL